MQDIALNNKAMPPLNINLYCANYFRTTLLNILQYFAVFMYLEAMTIQSIILADEISMFANLKEKLFEDKDAVK